MLGCLLLDLWDRFVERHTTVCESPWMSFPEDQRYGWFVWEDGATWCHFFMLKLPFVRSWGPVIRNYNLDEQGWRDHRLFYVRGNSATQLGWRIEPPFP